MSEYRGLVYRSELAARRAAARDQWVRDVERSHLNEVAKAVLTDPRNLEAWWPSEAEDEVAA